MIKSKHLFLVPLSFFLIDPCRFPLGAQTLSKAEDILRPLECAKAQNDALARLGTLGILRRVAKELDVTDPTKLREIGGQYLKQIVDMKREPAEAEVVVDEYLYEYIQFFVEAVREARLMNILSAKSKKP